MVSPPPPPLAGDVLVHVKVPLDVPDIAINDWTSVISPLGTLDFIPPPILYSTVKVVLAGDSPRVLVLFAKFIGSTNVSISISSPGIVIPTWFNCINWVSKLWPLLSTPFPNTIDVVLSSLTSVINLFGVFKYSNEYGTGTCIILVPSLYADVLVASRPGVVDVNQSSV